MLNYEKAFKRIIREELKGNNPVPDILSFIHLRALYGSDFSSVVDSLFREYQAAPRKPKDLLDIDVPKANFAIRPMSRPETKDWILYEALTDFLATNAIVDEDICKRSYSYLNFKEATERNNNWIPFDNKSRQLYNAGFKHAVVADLTGYYENISLDELRHRIVNCAQESEELEGVISVLFALLRKWSDKRVGGYGLPQGPPASSFLADIHLDYIDRKMETYENYFRYMDDIRIFTRTFVDAKIALKRLIIALRSLKLNINAKKTRILSNEQIEKELFDPKKELLNEIHEAFTSRNSSRIRAIRTDLKQLFRGSFLNNPFEKTHLNFSLYRLGILQAAGIIDFSEGIRLILANIVTKPQHTALFCNFLTLFPNETAITDELFSFLKSQHNIYEWQEVKILQSLLRFNMTVSRTDINFCIESATNASKHFVSRAFYFLLSGKFGNNRDRELIRDSFTGADHSFLKISMVLAVQELGIPARNAFYSRIKLNDEDEEVRQFVDYVKSLRHPIYYIPGNRPTIETIEEGAPAPY